MKKIKTFTDACKVLGLSAKSLPDVSALTKEQAKSVIAHFKLVLIAEALNEGWKPNWKDSSEYKYYPWFEMDSPSGFRFDDVYYDFAYSTVGSRLCFKNEALAKYAGKQFIDLYKALMVL
jgi:hypothetical protein